MAAPCWCGNRVRATIDAVDRRTGEAVRLPLCGRCLDHEDAVWRRRYETDDARPRSYRNGLGRAEP